MTANIEPRYNRSDPAVIDLGKFLEAAPLSNSTVANLPGGQNGVTNLLAQAILNWQANIVFDQGEWVSRQDVENTPDFGEVEVRTIGAEEAFRLVHRETGIVALEETRDAAWRSLKQKVRAALRPGGEESGDGE
ncbi:hypothetical protein CH267_01040 [Rhodococcus sp. 06-621-2]|nr:MULTISPECIES: hypothetical protein [unclassified Rhodococcus (in: high G+C Gram-positive bacteria)]OZC62159.1 hypothetical protein CH267_01040 [Rhodococcus sp. 06-621-2]OZF09802.1 hypothetical protein CH300_00025 [Rhodococcus sp. 15-1154-1]